MVNVKDKIGKVRDYPASYDNVSGIPFSIMDDGDKKEWESSGQKK